VCTLVRQVAVAIQFVEDAVVVPGDHAKLLLLLVLLALQVFPIGLADSAEQLLAIRRPGKLADLSLDVGQFASFAAAERDEVNLRRFLFVGAVGEEGDLAAIRGETHIGGQFDPVQVFSGNEAFCSRHGFLLRMLESGDSVVRFPKSETSDSVSLWIEINRTIGVLAAENQTFE